MCHPHHFHSVTPDPSFSPNRPHVIRIDFKSDVDLNCRVGGERLIACVIDQLCPCFVGVRDFEKNECKIELVEDFCRSKREILRFPLIRDW